MALDRQSIEKRDFPIGRRGYEPEAVDVFLGQLADEVEALQRAQARRTTESLAQAASEQVRAIVEAAESSAADIERAAEEEASQIRREAAGDAERTRNDAVERARDHVGAVSESTATMLQRVTAMQNELDGLVENLRTGANRVSADLALLEGNMAELYTAAGARTEQPAAPPPAAPAVEPLDSEPLVEVEPEPEPLLGPDNGDALVAETALEAEFVEAEIDAEAAAEAEVATAPEAVEEEDDDVEGARLIALNMALNGQSRDETDRYLADNFDLPDRQRLLDEVYASVEG